VKAIPSPALVDVRELQQKTKQNQTKASKNMSVVLVTGGSGYIASHIIHQLLDDASISQIRATMRNLSDTHKVKHLNDYAERVGKKIEWHQVANLTDDSAFDSVVQGVHFVFHVASPYFYASEDVERDIVVPAVEGTLSVLRACQKYAASTVKRVVITGSGTAIFNLLNIIPDKVYTEKDWNTEATAATSPYPYSKTVSEKAAWNFVETEKPSFGVTTLLPGYVLGPPLNDYQSTSEFNTSLKVFMGQLKTLFEQSSVKAIPSPALVDVRDIAQAHIAVAKRDNCANKRLFMAASGSVWAKDLLQLRKYALEKLPGDHPLAQKFSSITPVVEGDLEDAEKKTFKVDISTLLTLAPEVTLRPREDTLLDTLTWFAEHKFI